MSRSKPRENPIKGVKELFLRLRRAEKLEKLEKESGVEKWIGSVFAVAFFLLPILFLPLTSEFYETAKLALLGLSVIVLAFLTISPSLQNRALILPPTFLFPAVLLILIIMALGTFFSIDPINSLYGLFSSPHGSLLSYLIYFGTFVLLGSFLGSPLKITRILKFWTGGAVILAALATLQYFSLYLFPMEYTQQRFWTPMGSPTLVAVYLASSIFLAAYLVKEADKQLKPLWLGAVIIEVLALTLLGNPVAWLAIFTGVIALVAVGGKAITQPAYQSVKLVGAVLVIGAVLGSSGVRRAILPSNLNQPPTEIILDWGGSWSVTSQILASQPILGLGPETFGLIYPQVKSQIPMSFQNVNLNYPRAGVEVLQLVSGLGLAGIAAIGFLLAALIVTLKNKKEAFPQTPFLGGAVVAGLTAWFLAPAGVGTTTALFAGLGLLATASTGGLRILLPWPDLVAQINQKIKSRSPLPAGLVVGAKVIGIGIFTVLLSKYFLAEFHYHRAIQAYRAGDGQLALEAAGQAIQLNPGRDEYSVGAATINLTLASSFSQQPEATQAGSPAAQAISNFANAAVNQARRATALGPRRAVNWQNLAEVYRNLLTYLPGAGPSAAAAYQQAIQLDPADASLSLNLGNLLLTLQQPQDAAAAFQNTIRIRPDLVAGHLGLARALRLGGDFENSIKAYEQLLTFNFDQNPDVYQMIKNEYDETKTAAETEKQKPVEETPGQGGPKDNQPVSEPAR